MQVDRYSLPAAGYRDLLLTKAERKLDHAEEALDNQTKRRIYVLTVIEKRRKKEREDLAKGIEKKPFVVQKESSDDDDSS